MDCIAGKLSENLVYKLFNDFSVLFYTKDGFAYYGRVKNISDEKIALLIPGAGQKQVLIRHPDQTFCPQGSSIIHQDFTCLDLDKVVAVTAPLFSVPTGFVIG